MTDMQRFAIERKSGMTVAREGIKHCQWRLVRKKKEDPIGCSCCDDFKNRTCPFRKFLDNRRDQRAWVDE